SVWCSGHHEGLRAVPEPATHLAASSAQFTRASQVHTSSERLRVEPASDLLQPVGDVGTAHAVGLGTRPPGAVGARRPSRRSGVDHGRDADRAASRASSASKSGTNHTWPALSDSWTNARSAELA